MLTHHSDPEPGIFLLADHLDATLAAGEDLLAVRGRLAPAPASALASAIQERAVAQRRFVERVRALELTTALRGLEARKRAQRLQRGNPHLRSIAGLFVAGTAALADAVEELGDPTRFDFQTGHEMVAYLRSRALIAPDMAGPVDLDQLEVTPGFRVARRIELGPLMDLTAAFLDALDHAYEIYAGVPGAPAPLPAAADEDYCRPV